MDINYGGMVDALAGLVGGGGGGDAAGAAGDAAGAGLSGANDAAAAAGTGAGYGGLLDPNLLGLGLKGAEFGYGLANQPGKGPDTTSMSMPSNLAGQSNPGLLRQRAMGSSADLQSRGLDVGASPDFLQKQMESELGLTPDEFQRIFRLGGGGQASGGGGAT